MRTWLVTGGAGFIGSHLCEALLSAGDAVRVLDDLSSGKRENLPEGAVLIEGDVTDAAIVRDVLRGVAGCFHLAAIASVERGVKEWPATHRINQTGAVTVFDAIRRLGEPIPVVYASSAAIYGNARDLPISETDKGRPLSAYGADKLGCELQAYVASHVHTIPTVGLRFFNVYGPRQDPKSPYSGVISIFCEKIRRGTPVDIFGDGGQTRDFVHVSDVVRALRAAMQLEVADAPVFNVCTGIETPVLALAQTIADLTGKGLDVHYQWPRAGEVRHSRGCRKLSHAKLGLPEPVTLRTGLRDVLDWLDRTG